MDERVRTIGEVLGLFALLGIGVGLTNFVILDQFIPEPSGQDQFGQALVAGLLILQAIAFLYLIGPALAVVAGLYTGTQAGTPTDGAITAGIGSFLGFYVLFILGFLIMSMAFPESAGDGGDSATRLGNNVVQMILVGIPTGGVGFVTGYIMHGDSS